MSSTHHIRFVPGDTYDRTVTVRRRTSPTTTTPYDFTGYEITCFLSADVDPPLDPPVVAFTDEEGGEFTLSLDSDQTTDYSAAGVEITYDVVVSLNTDDIILTLLRGKVIPSD